MPVTSLPAAAAPAEAAITHPEEMKATYDISVGPWIRLQGSARITPAGVICTGLATAAILLATSVVVRAVRG